MEGEIELYNISFLILKVELHLSYLTILVICLSSNIENIFEELKHYLQLPLK